VKLGRRIVHVGRMKDTLSSLANIVKEKIVLHWLTEFKFLQSDFKLNKIRRD